MTDEHSADRLNRRFVSSTFEALVGRRPNEAEFAYGMARAGHDPREYVLELLESPEVQRHLEVGSQEPPFVPPGHFYSPIVNVAELRAMRARGAKTFGLRGVAHDPARYFECFKELSVYFRRIPLPVEQTEGFRYYSKNVFYSHGDALILSAFIQKLKPKRIIEVGSGFSSAVILDTLDRMDLDRMDKGAQTTKCVFIEPYAKRLKSLLRGSDYDRVTIIEKPVQQVDLAVFAELEAGDILFLDTTHVFKTGSDVQHELFHVLPELKPGVMVHFHDVFNGFEYPDTWTIKENRSWNEIYALRAFLMYNNTYEIVFMNDAVGKTYPDKARAISPEFVSNPGGGLYLRKLPVR